MAKITFASFDYMIHFIPTKSIVRLNKKYLLIK